MLLKNAQKSSLLCSILCFQLCLAKMLLDYSILLFTDCSIRVSHFTIGFSFCKAPQRIHVFSCFTHFTCSCIEAGCINAMSLTNALCSLVENCAYHAGIMSYACGCLLCLLLCRHNQLEFK